jgi:hypothetical protein
MITETQTSPRTTVIRFKLRSATPDEFMELDTPPPNISATPPPRPLWSKIIKIRSTLVMASNTISSFSFETL